MPLLGGLAEVLRRTNEGGVSPGEWSRFRCFSYLNCLFEVSLAAFAFKVLEALLVNLIGLLVLLLPGDYGALRINQSHRLGVKAIFFSVLLKVLKNDTVERGPLFGVCQETLLQGHRKVSGDVFRWLERKAKLKKKVSRKKIRKMAGKKKKKRR